MKKVLLILFSVALLLSMAGVATAAEETQEGSASGEQLLSKVTPQDSVTVYYSAEETYTVTIPEFVRFGGTEQKKTVATSVTASTVVLDSTQVLNLSVSSKHSWHMCQHTSAPGEQETADEDLYIPYSLTYTLNSIEIILSESNPGPASVMLVPTGTDEKTTELTFKMLDNAPETGTYKDTLVFTAVVE